MLKRSSIALSTFGALALCTMSAPVEAKKVGEWTCYDFLKASQGEKSRVVYFFQGINLADKKENLDLSAKAFNVPISKVVQVCQKNRSMPLWDAIVTHFNLP